MAVILGHELGAKGLTCGHTAHHAGQTGLGVMWCLESAGTPMQRAWCGQDLGPPA